MRRKKKVGGEVRRAKEEDRAEFGEKAPEQQRSKVEEVEEEEKGQEQVEEEKQREPRGGGRG